MPLNYMEMQYLADDLDQSSSGENQEMLTPKLADPKETLTKGFRNYLEQFRKRQPDMSRSESFRQARAKYNTLSQTSRAKYERNLTRRPISARGKSNEPTDMAYAGNEYNGRTNGGDLVKTAGFQNYVKLYMCKNPGFSKCVATKKALSLYKKLPERTKEKYRDLGYDFKCCPKKKKNGGCPKQKKCCPKPPSGCPQPPPPFCSPCDPKPPCKPCPSTGCKPKCCARPTCCGGDKKDGCAKKKSSPKKKSCC